VLARQPRPVGVSTGSGHPIGGPAPASAWARLRRSGRGAPSAQEHPVRRRPFPRHFAREQETPCPRLSPSRLVPQPLRDPPLSNCHRSRARPNATLARSILSSGERSAALCPACADGHGDTTLFEGYSRQMRHSNDSSGHRRQHHGYGRRNHRLPPIHRSRIHRANAFLPASFIRTRAMVGAPRLPGQPAARQSTKRRDTAAMPQHKRHRVAIRRVGEQLERFPLTGREDHESAVYRPAPPLGSFGLTIVRLYKSHP
jgi:hypothetical protein